MMELTDLGFSLSLVLFSSEYSEREKKPLSVVQKRLAIYAVDLEQTDKLGYEL